MRRARDYAVVRIHDDSYRLDRLILPGPGATAFVLLCRDRLGNPLGWRLKPLFVMRGSKSRLWPTPAEALASTLLLTKTEARDAIAHANAYRPDASREASP